MKVARLKLRHVTSVQDGEEQHALRCAQEE